MPDILSQSSRSTDIDPEEIEFPHANIVAVEALATVLETAFGPFSQDKLLAEKLDAAETPARMPEQVNYVVTSDGATVLQQLDIEHPMGPIIQRLIGPKRPGDTDVEGEDIPDGITGTVLLTAALLTEAKGLLELGLHPRSITRGYQVANRAVRSELDRARRPLSSFHNPNAAAESVALTAMTGNDIDQRMKRWANLAVEAVETVGPPTEESFVIRQFSEGTIADSRLIHGAILDRNGIASDEMPKRIEQAHVLILDGQDDGGLRKADIPEHYQITHEEAGSQEEFARTRQQHREDFTEQLRTAGVDIVVARQGIESEYYDLLSEADIAGVQAVSKLDLRQVALATGAEPVLITDEFGSSHLGHAGLVEERTVEPIARGRPKRRIVVFEDCPDTESVAVALHGVWETIADQATRAIRKAAVSVSEAKGMGDARGGVVPGGGAIDTRVASTLRAKAKSVDNRSQLAIEAFADAVDRVTAVLVRNGGADPITVLAELRTAHKQGDTDTGFIYPEGELQSAIEAGVLDPYTRHRLRYISAVQVANLILGIDETLDATFSHEPAGPDESINPDAARRQMDALDTG